MYKGTAKQAKAVLRIPRLCHTYHNKIKHTCNEEESSKLLEDLFNEYYAATSAKRNANTSLSPGDEEGYRPLSKIEESLMDRSMINASVGTKKSTERAGTQSPHLSDYIPEQLSSAQYSIIVPNRPGEVRVKRAFAGSFDNTAYEGRDA